MRAHARASLSEERLARRSHIAPRSTLALIGLSCLLSLVTAPPPSLPLQEKPWAQLLDTDPHAAAASLLESAEQHYVKQPYGPCMLAHMQADGQAKDDVLKKLVKNLQHPRNLDQLGPNVEGAEALNKASRDFVMGEKPMALMGTPDGGASLRAVQRSIEFCSLTFARPDDRNSGRSAWHHR